MVSQRVILQNEKRGFYNKNEFFFSELMVDIEVETALSHNMVDCIVS